MVEANKDVNINLDLIEGCHDHVVKKSRDLDEEELKAFILECLKHESHNLSIRKQKYDAGEITEEDLNEFPFYTDGYRVGVSVKLTDDTLLKMKVRDAEGKVVKVQIDGKLVDKEVEAKILYKKKDGNYEYDDDGKKIPTGRVIFRIKSRLGDMGVFLGTKKFQLLMKNHLYVLVGLLNTQYYNMNTRDYDAEKKEDVQYGNASYSLNGFQFGEIVRKGKGIQIIIPEINWHTEDE